MPEKSKPQRIFFTFLIVLAFINLLQGYNTELILDEAYYWYFSQNLSWGYFDHPPMVAFLVKIGALIFKNELGIRFFSAFLFSGTAYFLWQLIEDEKKHKNVWLFCVLIASLALFNVYGFFMLPDTPLLFFAALFLFGYKKFLDNENPLAIFILALSMAGMMYSKYHGILIIGFTILSNLRLLTRARFWYAAIFSLILYLPHLYWLYTQDFASLKYHLFDRANSFYKLRFTIEYLTNFFVVWGFAFPLLYWSLIKSATKNTFEQALKYITYGIFIFFLIASFNRSTQAQWPILVILPLIIISFNYALVHKKFRKWLFITSSCSLVVLYFLRFAIVYENISPIVYESHGNKKWVAELKEKSKGRPVVFRNSYSEASMYTFYSGIEAMSANGYPFRQNQFDKDSSEYRFQHKDVVYLSSQKGADSSFGYVRPFRNLTWKGIFIDDYYSWRKLKISLDEEEFNKNNDTIDLIISNPYNTSVSINQLNLYGLSLNRKKAIADTLDLKLQNSHKLKAVPANGSLEVKAVLTDTEKLEEASYFRIVARENNLSMGFQGNIISLKK